MEGTALGVEDGAVAMVVVGVGVGVVVLAGLEGELEGAGLQLLGSGDAKRAEEKQRRRKKREYMVKRMKKRMEAWSTLWTVDTITFRCGLCVYYSY